MNQVIRTIRTTTNSNFIRSDIFSNLVELLRSRALNQPNHTAFTFLHDKEGLESTVTYEQLDAMSRAIAVYLQNISTPEDRVLLLYPPGIDYIAAFFGCLYADLIAIPLYQPKNNRNMSRIQSIMEDSQAQIALTNHQTLVNVQTLLNNAPDLKQLQWLATDTIDQSLADQWELRSISSDAIAYLQYTSGSTSTPKGVMISHENALCNSAEIAISWRTGSDSILVSWLPHFHDFGQIYGVIQPIYSGFPCIFMSPASFTQKPIRWLKAISDYKATHSGAPNFAYDLCVDKIKPEQRVGLDLSNWQVTVNGAEPVRQQTLEKFYTTFAPYGFRWGTFYPGYGLAEATLKVSSARQKNSPTLLTVQTDSLSKNLIVETSQDEPFARTVVGCGKTVLNAKVVIVDPESLTPSPTGQVGEIWVSGPSVAQGYWGRQEETQRTFGAYLADNGEGPFLRTGDLGFLKDDELFITGRIKDLIVIRGSNHYPQDIELTVEQSHPSLRSGYSAAFAIDENEQERLVIVCEIERTYLRKFDTDEVIRTIRQAVSKEHELEVYAVVLLRTGSIPKTSSGKIQRRACLSQFLNNELDVVGEWKDKSDEQVINKETSPMQYNLSSIIKLGIQDWLMAWIAKEKKLHIREIDPNQSLTYYSLSSLDSMNLHGDLETWLGYSIVPDWLWDAPSIDALATQISHSQNPDFHNKVA
ncbi:AMP-binding protein [Anabaena aphanizomenioides LEGE 00250]|uniref:AMP-binding protein n=1 Tax=Sphaerospermopsis aphanizomenoides LEGE 00250 TaxID=2777972 RepID=A0ABR9VA02_9CYAN|nr:AMP-binding protein [Sphaerospermopsis aphanizomenoides]MBE9235316.1 AMP-binding protein [Sphaerospermopsis aphanizomenoides LEGE 00250]